jgi:hypothetical protein
MRSRLSVAMCIILGSFFLYCGQSTMNAVMTAMDGGIRDLAMVNPDDLALLDDLGSLADLGFLRDFAFVRDAAAQGACCTQAAQTFTKLAEGDISDVASTSSVLSVGPYRELVVYMTNSSTGSGGCITGLNACCPCLQPQFRADGSSPFSGFGPSFCYTEGGRVRVDGPDFRLGLNTVKNTGLCNATSYHYVVAGVQ